MQNSFCAAAEQIRLYITILGLTFSGFSRIISYVLPGVAQLVARMVRVHEAVGSTPATRTTKNPVTTIGYRVFYIVRYTLRYTFSISDDFCERGIAICCDTIQVSILQMAIDTLGVHVLGMSECSLF